MLINKKLAYIVVDGSYVPAAQTKGSSDMHAIVLAFHDYRDQEAFASLQDRT